MADQKTDEPSKAGSDAGEENAAAEGEEHAQALEEVQLSRDPFVRARVCVDALLLR